MKKILLAAMALVALPVVVHAQSLQYPGFYIGAEGRDYVPVGQRG